MQPPALNDEHDHIQPSETTPLVSRPGQASRRLKSYINDFRSSKRRQRSTVRLHKQPDKLDVSATAQLAANEPSPSKKSDSTLVSSCADRDASAAWQSSCKPPQTDSLNSPSPSRQPQKSLLSTISLTLENHGSVARDHLASERTFLAYMRTSLAIASSGVALVQLFAGTPSNLPPSSEHRLLTCIRPLGATTIVMGLIVLLIGVVRYFSIQAALTKGYFPAARIVTGFITLILIILVIVTFAILLVGELDPSET